MSYKGNSWKDLKQHLASHLTDAHILALCSVLDVPPAEKGNFVGGITRHEELFSWMEDIRNPIKLSEWNVKALVEAFEDSFVHRADLADIVRDFRPIGM